MQIVFYASVKVMWIEHMSLYMDWEGSSEPRARSKYILCLQLEQGGEMRDRCIIDHIEGLATEGKGPSLFLLQLHEKMHRSDNSTVRKPNFP